MKVTNGIIKRIKTTENIVIIVIYIIFQDIIMKIH